MYVKVVPRHTPQFTIYDVSHFPIHFGRHWSEVPPEDRPYSEELGETISKLYLDGIVDLHSNDEQPEALDRVDPQWEYSYAWWFVGEMENVVCVVTSGTLYIVGDNGKTIDKA